MQTRGAIIRQTPGKYEVVDLEVDDPREGEVQVKLVASGLCHSDDHVATGDIPVGVYPFAGGHEGSGIITKAGYNTKGLKEGDHVVFSFLPSCGHCRWCASGMQNLCDLGAGLLQARPGRADARRWLSTPLGLAWRLHRGALSAWAFGVTLLGFVYGGLGESVETLLGENPDAQVFFPTSSTADLVDSYLGVTLRITALLVAAYAVSATCRARTEEMAGRAEPLLAAGVSRFRWLASHLTVALAGSTALLVLDGLATGISRALATGNASEVPRLTGAALGYVPAVWVVAGVTAALIGLLPSVAVSTAWASFGVVLVITLFGESLDWPAWVSDLSPLAQTPTMPAESWSSMPVLALLLLATTLLAAGAAAFRRRDLTSG